MDMTDKMIAVFIGAILAGALIPVALQSLATGVVADNVSLYGGYNWTGSDAIVTPTELALYAVIPIALIVAVVVLFFKVIK